MSLATLQAKVNQHDNSKDDEVKALVRCLPDPPVLTDADKQSWMQTVLTVIEKEAQEGKTKAYVYGHYGTDSYVRGEQDPTRSRRRQTYDFYSHAMGAGYSVEHVTFDEDVKDWIRRRYKNQVKDKCISYTFDFESPLYPHGLGFWRIDVRDKIFKIKSSFDIISTSNCEVRQRVIGQLEAKFEAVTKDTFRCLADYWTEHSDIPMNWNDDQRFTFDWSAPVQEPSYEVRVAREHVNKYRKKLRQAEAQLEQEEARTLKKHKK